MSEIIPLSDNKWRLAAAGLDAGADNPLQDAGLTGLLIPSQFDGDGGSVRDAVEALVGAGQADTSIGVALASHYAVTGQLLAHGDRDAVAVVARHAANDRSLWADLREDPDNPLTIRRDTDGGATITGVSAPTHGVTLADTIAVTVPDPDSSGRLVAVLPADREGLTADEPVERFGLRRAPAANVIFDDVRVEPGELIGIDSPSTLLSALRPLFDGAVIAGASFRSVERARDLTLVRKIPRPVPGVKAATADPLSQTALGTGLLESGGAVATALRAASDFDRQLSREGDLDPIEVERLTVRGLAANEVSLSVGLSQGKNVFEVVGTSGSANKHAFDELWRDARVLSLRQPRAERRRRIGLSFLEDRGSNSIAGSVS